MKGDAYTPGLAKEALVRGANQLLGYLAGPMSSDPEGFAMKAAHLSRNLTQRFGVQFFVPHSCVLLQKHAPRTVEEWLEMDGAILRRCDFLYLMDGWQDSIGAKAEFDIALRFGLRIVYTPEDLEAFLVNRAMEQRQA